MSVKATKQRHTFPYATMKSLATHAINGSLSVKKQQLKEAILTSYDSLEGAETVAAISQTGFEKGKLKGVSMTITCTKRYLAALEEPTDKKVTSIYKKLSLNEPNASLSEKVSNLQQALSARLSKAYEDKKQLDSTKNSYETLMKEYTKTRSAVVKDWRLKYSKLISELRRDKDTNPRLVELRTARESASNSEEKKQLLAEIKSLLQKLDEDLSSRITDVTTISQKLGVTTDEAKRLVPVFDLRRQITDVNDVSVRVSHVDHLLSIIAESEVVEILNCVRSAYCERIRNGGTMSLTVDDLVAGLPASADPISAFLRSSVLYRKLLSHEEVTYSEESKSLKPFVLNVAKSRDVTLTKELVAAVCGLVFDSLTGLSVLFKTDNKTVSKGVVRGVLRTLLTSHGFECGTFDDVVDEAFSVAKPRQ